MSKIRVKGLTLSDPTTSEPPHWLVVVDYGALDEIFRIPAKLLVLEGEDPKFQYLDAVEAMESLGTALLDFAELRRAQRGFPPKKPDKNPR
jgi:hypothetical protein